MVVCGEDNLATGRGQHLENFAVIGDTESLRQLAAHWIVVHYDCPQVPGGNSTKQRLATVELGVRDHPNYREVAQPSRQRVWRDAVRAVEAHKGGAVHMQDRLNVGIEPAAILARDAFRAEHVQRRAPPCDVMISRDRDRLSILSRIPNERCAGHELADARALREIAAKRHHVVALSRKKRFQSRDEIRSRRLCEVKIADLQNAQRAS